MSLALKILVIASSKGPALAHHRPLGSVSICEDDIAGTVIQPLDSAWPIVLKILQALLRAHSVYPIQVHCLRPPLNSGTLVFPLLIDVCTTSQLLPMLAFGYRGNCPEAQMREAQLRARAGKRILMSKMQQNSKPKQYPCKRMNSMSQMIDSNTK